MGQLIYALLWLLPTPILFHVRFINTTFLLVLVVAGICCGESYYIFVFSKVIKLLSCCVVVLWVTTNFSPDLQEEI